MKIRNLLLPCFMICLAPACKKYAELTPDLAGDLYYRGRAFYNEEIYRSPKVSPLGGISVKLYNSTDEANYLYSVTADKDGYFTFSHLEKDKIYFVGADTTLASVRYSVRRMVQLGISRDTAALTLDLNTTQQNGIVYIIKDASGGLVANTNVCLFKSALLASRDTCEGSNYSLPPSNAEGRSAILNIPSGTYYAILYYQFGAQKLFRKDTVTVPQPGILTREIVLR